MSTNDPRSVIKRLKRAGMTESEIADALKERGIEVSQPTINRIASGKHRTTTFDIGMGLIRLEETRAAVERRA